VRLFGGAGSHSPNPVVQMVVGSVVVVRKGRIVLGRVGYQTGVADWPGDQPGRPRTRGLVGRHLLQGLIGIPMACQTGCASFSKSFLPVMGPGERPGGLVEESGQPGCAFGSSEEDSKARRERPP
jgi:hypothetical protein